MGSGKAKKARKAVFQEGKDPSSLPKMQQVYINKEVNKMVNQLKINTGSAKGIVTPRAFPCQKLKGQYAYIKDTDKPVLKDDGLWYLDDELIVSDYYKAREAHRAAMAKHATELLARKEAEKNIKELKPTVLGEDGN